MKRDTGLLMSFGTTAIASLMFVGALTDKLCAQTVLRFDPPQDRIGEGVIEDGFLFSAPRAPQFVNGGGLNFIDPSPGLNNWNGLNTVPYNGTYYAQPYTGSEPVLTQTDDLPFALDSFDYAPLSATYNGTNTILVTGYDTRGGTITTQLVWDGQVQGIPSDFHTFYFGGGWASLTQVVMFAATPWAGYGIGFSIDNIAVSPIPEPGALFLVGFGAATVLMIRVGRWRRNGHQNGHQRS